MFSVLIKSLKHAKIFFAFLNIASFSIMIELSNVNTALSSPALLSPNQNIHKILPISNLWTSKDILEKTKRIESSIDTNSSFHDNFEQDVYRL